MTKPSTAARRKKLDGLIGRPSTPYKTQFDSLGAFLQAVHHAGVDGIEAADPKLEYRLVSGDHLDFFAAAGADAAIPSAGGFLVQPDHAHDLHKRLYTTGGIISRCASWPAPKETLRLPMVDENSRSDGSRFGGVSMGFFAPGAEITASKPKFRLSEFNRRKLAGIAYTSGELIEDAPQLGATFATIYALEGAFVLENEIINGGGVVGPLGILNSDCLITVDKESGQVAATITAANIVSMAGRFWAAGWPRATWLCNQDILPQLLSLRWTDASGAVVPLLTFGNDGPRLVGAPVIFCEACQTVGTVGDIILADLDQYILTSPRDLDMVFSPHVKFTTFEGAWRFRLRVDGAAAWNSATTPLNGTATVSPFVCLAGRA